MSFKRKVFDKIFPPLNEKLSAEAHGIVLDQINQLDQFIPIQYKKFKLIHIILAKVYGYNTGYDEIVNIHFRIKFGLYKFLFNDKPSELLANKLLPYRVSWIKDTIRHLKEEQPTIVYNKSTDPLKNIDINDSYNILFANFPSYFIPLIKYMDKSTLSNNLIAIPSAMRNNSIFNNVLPEKILILDDFVTEDINKDYFHAKEEFNDIYESNKQEIKKIFCINNYNLFEFIDEGISITFKYLLPQTIFFMKTLDELFSKVKVDNIIGSRVRRIYDRAFHIAALNNHVRSYILLHANIGNDIRWVPSMGHFNFIHGIFLWGDDQRDLIKKDIYSNIDNLHVVGSPLFDSSPRKKQNLDRKYTIIYAAGNSDKEEVKLLIGLLDEVPSNTNLIIKVHPSIDLDSYNEFNNLKNVEVINTGITEDLLDEIIPEILITISSNSGFQSLVRKIPTVFLLFNNIDKWSQTFDQIYNMTKSQKQSFQIKERTKLIEVINMLLESKKYRSDFIQKQWAYISTKMKTYDVKNGATTQIDSILNKSIKNFSPK